MRRCLKTANDCADVVCNGRAFHMLAPATGNGRLPTVDREAEDRCRRLDVMSATRVKHDCIGS